MYKNHWATQQGTFRKERTRNSGARFFSALLIILVYMCSMNKQDLYFFQKSCAIRLLSKDFFQKSCTILRTLVTSFGYLQSMPIYCPPVKYKVMWSKKFIVSMQFLPF